MLIHERLVDRRVGEGQQSEQALVKTLRSPGLHLDAGLRFVAALHEQALRTARRVDEHKPGGLDARVVEAVHSAARSWSAPSGSRSA